MRYGLQPGSTPAAGSSARPPTEPSPPTRRTTWPSPKPAAVAFERDEQLTWLSLTEIEEANLLLAIDRSLDREDVETAGRITWLLRLYWWMRGQLTVGRRRAERCLAAQPPPRCAPGSTGGRHDDLRVGGDPATGARHWAEAIASAVEQGTPRSPARGPPAWAWPALAQGDLGDAATAHFREGVALGAQAQESGHWLCSLAQVWLGTVPYRRSPTRERAVEIGRGLELARERGDRLSTYVALYNLARPTSAPPTIDRPGPISRRE